MVNRLVIGQITNPLVRCPVMLKAKKASMADFGRPSVYDPAFCARIIELGDTGASMAEMAYEIGVTKQTLHNWAATIPDFFVALECAKLASQTWWEKKGRAGMEKSSQEFQASIWSRSMAARFPDDWREVKGTELTGKDGGAIKTESKVDVSSLSDAALRELAQLDPE